MKAQELISVIVPIYEVEKYLDKCIKSIVEQTYENLEIILVDDGSPDNCPQICDVWEKKDQRIKVIHKANGGLSDARNAGLAVATGEYIGFVDSDDYIENKMYERLYMAIRNENADLAICDYEKVMEDGSRIMEESPIKNETFSGIKGLEKLAEFGGVHYLTVWNKLYTSKALKNIEFPVGKIHEDEFVIHKILFQCKKIVTVDPKAYKYVQRSGSIISGTKGVKTLDLVEAWCDRFYFYKQCGLDEFCPKLLKSIRKVYIERRIQIPEKIDKKDRKRVREIDSMFKALYLKYAEKVPLKMRIRYYFPTIWFFFYKKKNTM